ncbi:MAG: hypothetical protein IKU01_03855 [Bacteroidales bacterium]|nr:hypothetical protein [Bacteroidales bacterium]
MKIKSLIFAFLCLLSINKLFSQELLIPLNDDYEMEIQAAAYNSAYRFHTATKSWSEYQFRNILNIDSLNKTQFFVKDFDKKWKNLTWNSIFNTDFIGIKTDDYYIAINPIVDFDLGKDNGKTTWVNTRGAEIKGTIGDNFAFYSNLRENQAVFPDYLTEYARTNKVVPGQGHARRFKETGFDYANASAYIAIRPMYWIQGILGYGKNFIGDGYRSLILSDNAFAYPYVKLTADVWNIQYSCYYTQMTDKNRVLDDNTYARKYTVIHYLDWAVTKRLNLGLFDAIVCKGQDENGIKRGLDFQYLNPILFLRTTDYYAGSSPDNALLGASASLILGKHTTMYAQFVLDEMTVKEFIAFEGYWANKQSYQFGVKSYNCFGIKNLFLQSEFNLVRPYMYSHYSGEDNYAHLNQPLAHPWGANFYEVIARAQYNYKRFYFQYKMNFGQWGDDIITENGEILNYGHDVYLDYRDYYHIDGTHGHFLLTGELNTLLMNNIVVSWLINPSYNLNVFADITHRNQKIEGSNNLSNFIINFGIRTTLDRKYYDF